MKFIKFVLSAPLQSWGEDARWNQRTTAAMPTKSAIIGLLGSCLGIPRGDDRLNTLNNEIHIAVRADCPGRVMTDYQTINAPKGEALPTANGGHRKKGEGIETPKQYLQDARFTIFVWGNEDTLHTCYKAMWHPKWAVYLGRKSCVPAVPVRPDPEAWNNKWNTPEEAVKSFSEEEKRHCDLVVQVEMDAKPSDLLAKDQHLVIRRDALIRADRNEYGVRWVKAFAVPSGGEASCT